MIRSRGVVTAIMVTFLVTGLLLTACWAKEETEKKTPPHEAVTTRNPEVPIDQLELLVKPLTKDDLIIEANGWLALVKDKVEEVSAAEIAVKQKNNEIIKAKQLTKKIEEAKDSLKKVKEAAQTSTKDTTGEAAEKVLVRAQQTEEKVKAVGAEIEQTKATDQQLNQDPNVQKALKVTGVKEKTAGTSFVSDASLRAAQNAQTAAAAVTRAAKESQADTKDEPTRQVQKAEKVTTTAEGAQQALQTTGEAVKADVDKLTAISGQSQSMVDANAEIKTQILKAVADLRDERTALIDRFNVVLDELNAKLGKTPEGKDNEIVVPYRLYADAVGGIKVDVSDKEAAWATVTGWLTSEEGGIRWAKNIAIFSATVIGFWILGRIFGNLVEKALGVTRGGSILLRNFVVHSVRRVTYVTGIIIGLTALEVNIGPLLAIIGAAGFVVAFALQDTLSNFASGIMIMLYKPFDVGNFVDVAGVAGVVRSMNLVTTTITTADNQIMVVPNNSIWGNIITNITGSSQRRVDLVFGIGYNDDIGHARQVLLDIVEGHDLVLKDPAPVIQVHELAESSVNFICRPWAKTGDYWTVYWDLTRMVKERFDAEGISIPYPQRDVHLVTEPA